MKKLITGILTKFVKPNAKLEIKVYGEKATMTLKASSIDSIVKTLLVVLTEKQLEPFLHKAMELHMHEMVADVKKNVDTLASRLIVQKQMPIKNKEENLPN